MGPETIVTLIGVGVIVGALAVYLIVIAYSLVKISFTLGTVLIGVRSIAYQCEPLREVVGGIVEDVTAIEESLASLLPEEAEEAEEAEESEPEDDVPPPRRRRARSRS